MEERTYSIAEAARFIGISYARMWAKTREGKIKGIVRYRKDNRNFVEIPESEVLRLKERHDRYFHALNGNAEA